MTLSYSSVEKKRMNDKICRICMMNTRTKMINVFHYGLGDNFANAFLMRICDVKIYEGDGLPAEICSKCLRCLRATYKFKTQCELADKALRGLLKEKHEAKLPEVLDTSSIGKEFNTDYLTCNIGNNSTLSEILNQDLGHCNIISNSKANEQITIGQQTIPQGKSQVLADKSIAYRGISDDIKTSTTIIEQPVTKKIRGRQNATCAVCYQKFGDYEDYRIHVKKHNGEVDKPYKCKACGKGFLCMSQLNRHLFTHSDVKLYECSVCKKGFNNAAHMKSHMYVHTGEKPYSCSLCSKGFNQMPHLKRHMLSHNKSEQDNRNS